MICMGMMIIAIGKAAIRRGGDHDDHGDHGDGGVQSRLEFIILAQCQLGSSTRLHKMKSWR